MVEKNLWCKNFCAVFFWNTLNFMVEKIYGVKIFVIYFLLKRLLDPFNLTCLTSWQWDPI